MKSVKSLYLIIQ